MVEGLVGTLDEAFEGVLREELGDAEADGDGGGGGLVLVWCYLGYLAADAFGSLVGLV